MWKRRSGWCGAKALGKPFMVLLNAAQPESAEAQALRASLEEKYDVPVMAADATQMSLTI